MGKQKVDIVAGGYSDDCLILEGFGKNFKQAEKQGLRSEYDGIGEWVHLMHGDEVIGKLRVDFNDGNWVTEIASNDPNKPLRLAPIEGVKYGKYDDDEDNG